MQGRARARKLQGVIAPAARAARLDRAARALPSARLGKTLWRAFYTATNDGQHMRCKLLDVEPGAYTVYVAPDALCGKAYDEQPVVSREITVGAEDVTVELVVPRCGRADRGRQS